MARVKFFTQSDNSSSILEIIRSSFTTSEHFLNIFLHETKKDGEIIRKIQLKEKLRIKTF